MDLNELVEKVKKQGESPTQTMIRVIQRFSEEHPEEVNEPLTSKQMMEKILALEKRLSQKDIMIDKLMETQSKESNVQDGVIDAKPQVFHQPVPEPTKTVVNMTTQVQPQEEVIRPTQQAQNVQNVQNVQNEQQVQQLPSEQGQPMQVAPAVQGTKIQHNVEWAKSNSPMRDKIMQFIKEDKHID